MGSGSFDTSLHHASHSHRTATGTPHFSYTASTKSSSSASWKAHESLDPKLIKGARESRDSVEHPTTVAIGVSFDVTGSMEEVPQVMQEKLPFLLQFLIAQAGLEHPQVLISAFGDATCDQVPFQIGQFESDNRIDEDLRRVFLEGHGGGQVSESTCLAFYAASRKTSIDCLEKRSKKGYWFSISDEKSWDLEPEHAKAVFGDPLEAKLSIEQLVVEAQQKYEWFHIIPAHTMHGEDRNVHNFWKKLLGERVILLEDETKVCEAIAGQIGLLEGASFGVVSAAVGKETARALVQRSGQTAPNAIAKGTLPEAGVPSNDIDRF